MIRVDAGKKYQTVQGFGVTLPPLLDPAVYNHTFYDSLIGDLGCRVVRVLLPTQRTTTPDPDILGGLITDLSYMKGLSSDIRFLATIGAPPGVLCDEDGMLKAECRQAFAEYLFDMADIFEKRGVPLYALSFHDGSTESLPSVYGVEDYCGILKVMGEERTRRGSSLKLLGTEEDVWNAAKIKETFSKTTTALDLLGAQNRVSATWEQLMYLKQNNPEATIRDIYRHVFQDFSNTLEEFPHERWIVEACNENQSWKESVDYSQVFTLRDPAYYGALSAGAIDLALKICYALSTGNFSSYVYGLASTVLDESGDPTSDLLNPMMALCERGVKTFKYQAAKHFYRHILPGMNRIECVSDNVTSCAFMSNKIVCVLINDSNSILDTFIDIVGVGISSFSSYTSVEKEYSHEESGTAEGNRIEVSLLPNSIATYVVE